MSDQATKDEKPTVEEKKSEEEATELQEVPINSTEEQAATTPKDGKDEAAQPMIEKKKKKDKAAKVTVEIGDRDPNRLNDHVKVLFEDAFAEPDSTVYSFDSVWILSNTVFTGTKLWCYRITSLLCALPLAICWGMSFACLSFCNIWLWMPCLRGLNMKLFCVRSVWSIILNTFVAPCFEAMGRCFSGITVNNKTS